MIQVIGALNNMKHKGFTLIELLVVITIIGVLAALITTNLSDARARARDSQKKQNFQQLKTALRLYYNDNQAYPVDGGTPYNTLTLNSQYIQSIPSFRYYEQLDDGNGFIIVVALENPSDPDIAASQLTCPASLATSLTYNPNADYAVCVN
ncbi:MAG: type II secretion system protein [Patescibacteria group bacterium]|nr:type II secretion system protein [Patescibacteria group bacterium]